MTSSLHERLHRLADQVEVGADPSAGRDLWTRGRRYQRTRRVGTMTIAAVTVLLVAGIGAVTWQRSAPPPVPVPAEAPAGLPSRIHEPSPWLPGTAQDGPLGQLVAVQPAARGSWTGSSTGVVGISATTGEYRFLDLPDKSDATEVALAPDGRHLAYWLTGPTTDTPNTNGDYQEVATGVAVYDTLTGEVERHQIETAHGIGPSFLVWVDGDTLVLDHTQDVGGDDDSDDDQSSGRFAPALEWDLADPEPEEWALGDRHFSQLWGPSSGGRLVAVDDEDDLWFLGAAPPEGVSRRHAGSGSLAPQSIAMSPDGTRVAAVVTDGGANPNRVAVQALGAFAPDVIGLRRLPHSGRSFRVLGWTDDDHLAVERRAEPLRDGLGMAVFEVDASTGESSELVALPDGSWNVQWATDLLDSPSVDRPDPPTPLDPRVATGLLLATVIGAGVALVLWRRRVRP